MEARFVGDPNDNFSGPKIYPRCGIEFVKDEWTPIPDEHVEKLRGNSHFEVRDGKGPKAAPKEPKASEAPEPVVDIPAGASAFDPDGDGKVGGSTASPEKDALIAELEKIPGAEFDKRWGVTRLKAALDAAKFLSGEDD